MKHHFSLRNKYVVFLLTSVFLFSSLVVPAANAAPSNPLNLNISGQPTQPTVNWDPATTPQNGVDWTQLAGSIDDGGPEPDPTFYAPWSGRQGHTSVVFDNKMWVIGGTSAWDPDNGVFFCSGNDSDNYCTDVWYSEDGVSWTEATSSVPWAARSNHTSVVFDNKMWVIGGYAGDTNCGSGGQNFRCRDVWYSENGSTWIQATSSAAWPVRASHTSVVFDNKMWVMGGGNSHGLCPNNVCRDVWWSTNGVDWIQAASSAAWGRRYSHTSVVFDNKMWVIGGTSSGSSNDVWYSTDGTNWTQATASAAWSGRRWHTSVVFDNKMWVMGGWGSSVNNDVWYSEDGINWTQATDNLALYGLSNHSSVNFNNKMWVMGNNDSSAWYSQNGADWYPADYEPSLEPELPESFPARYSHTSVVFDNKLWVMGSYHNDVWYSADGRDWVLATDNPGWATRRNQSFAVFDNKLWATGGRSTDYDEDIEDYVYNNYNDVWYSTDGITWIQATDSAQWPARYGHATIAFGNKLWISGGVHYSYDAETEAEEFIAYTDVWYTEDGINWVKAMDEAPWLSWIETQPPEMKGQFAAFGNDLGGSNKFAVHNDELWVIANELDIDMDEMSFESTTKVWHSADGITWTEAGGSPPPGNLGAAVTVFDNKLWMMGGLSDFMSFESNNDVYYSTDGINWIQATDNATWPARFGHTAAILNEQLYVLAGLTGAGISSEVWMTPNQNISHYKVCWDTVQGGCASSANVSPTGTVLSANTSADSWLSKLGQAVGILPATTHAQSGQLSYTLPPLNPGTYHISVSAVSMSGQTSGSGSVLSFTINADGSLAETGHNLLPLAAATASLILVAVAVYRRSSVYRHGQKFGRI